MDQLMRALLVLVALLCLGCEAANPLVPSDPRVNELRQRPPGTLRSTLWNVPCQRGYVGNCVANMPRPR